MAVDGPVIRPGVLVSIRGAGVADPHHLPVEVRAAVHRAFLDDIVGEGDADALGDERRRRLALGRGDEVRGPEPVVRAPAAPVRELLHRAQEVRLGGQGGPLLARRRQARRRDEGRDERRTAQPGAAPAARRLESAVGPRRVPAARAERGKAPQYRDRHRVCSFGAIPPWLRIQPANRRRRSCAAAKLPTRPQGRAAASARRPTDPSGSRRLVAGGGAVLRRGLLARAPRTSVLRRPAEPPSKRTETIPSATARPREPALLVRSPA